MPAAVPPRLPRAASSTDRVDAELLGEMMELADDQGAALQAITDPRIRWKLARAIGAGAAELPATPRRPLADVVTAAEG